MKPTIDFHKNNSFRPSCGTSVATADISEEEAAAGDVAPKKPKLQRLHLVAERLYAEKKAM